MFLSAPAPETVEPEDPAETRRAQDLRLLEELADGAMALARAFQAKALAVLETAHTPDEHAVAVNHGRAFDRHARTVRQCLALKDRISRQGDAERRKTEDAEQAEFEDRFVHARARRGLVGLSVQEAIEADKRPRPETERLLADLDDLLETFDEDVYLERSIGEIAVAFCQELKVAVRLDLWRLRPWAEEEILSRPKGSPFAGHGPGVSEAPDGDAMARPP